MVLKKIGVFLNKPSVFPIAMGLSAEIILGSIYCVPKAYENKSFIMHEKARLEKVGAPKDSLDRFDTHGLNVLADVKDAFDIKAYGQRVDSVVKRTADSTEIAKIIPQATPAQICTTLTRLGR